MLHLIGLILAAAAFFFWMAQRRRNTVAVVGWGLPHHHRAGTIWIQAE